MMLSVLTPFPLLYIFTNGMDNYYVFHTYVVLCTITLLTALCRGSTNPLSCQFCRCLFEFLCGSNGADHLCVYFAAKKQPWELIS